MARYTPVHAPYEMRARMNQLRTQLRENHNLNEALIYVGARASWMADLDQIQKVAPDVHRELMPLTTEEARQAKIATNGASRTADDAVAHLAAGSEGRVNFYMARQEFEALRGADPATAEAFRWDPRKESFGPYLDTTRVGVEALDGALARIAPHMGDEAKQRFEAASVSAEQQRAADRAAVQSAAAQVSGNGRGEPHLPAGHEKRVDIFPSVADYDALKKQAERDGWRTNIRWDRQAEHPYVDMSRPGADKVPASDLKRFQTPEARKAYDAEHAELKATKEANRQTVRAAAETVSGQAQRPRREYQIKPEEQEFANRPLRMPKKGSQNYAAMEAEVKSKSTPALISALHKTEASIKEIRTEEAQLKEHGKTLAYERRGQLLDHYAGKEYIRGVLVDRGLEKFRRQDRTQGQAPAQAPAQAAAPAAQQNAAAAVPAGAAQPAAKPDAAPAQAQDPKKAEQAAVMSEAARLAAGLRMG